MPIPHSFALHPQTCGLSLRLAGGEEGIRHDLTCLASGGVSPWPEVGQVVRSTRFAYSSARVAIHVAKVG
jgi:hypothetical protein